MRNKLKYIPSLLLILATVFAGFGLTMPGARAETAPADAVVNVNDACTFDDDFSYTFTYAVDAGTADDTEDEARETTTGTGDKEITVSCNNINGFVIQAIGFSPDATHSAGYAGNTNMYSSTTSAVVATGAGATTGTIPTSTPSFWGMKITSATSPDGTVTINPTYGTTAHNYVAVPNATTTVVTYPGSTTGVVTGTMRPDYGFYISDTQPAATYTGKVKYTIVGN